MTETQTWVALVVFAGLSGLFVGFIAGRMASYRRHIKEAQAERDRQLREHRATHAEDYGRGQ